MKKFIFLIVLMFASNCVFAQDLFVDDHRYNFYKKYACYNKVYNNYDEVLKEFPDNYYYAVVKNIKARKPILFVSDNAYYYKDKDTMVSDYAIIYAYKRDKKPHVINFQYSDGYPLSATKRFFYWGGEDAAGRFRIDSAGTFITEKTIEKQVKDDKVTYNYFSYKGLPQGTQKKPRIFNKLNRELNRAKPIQFKQIKDKDEFKKY